MLTYHSIDVDGSSIFYREGGDPANPTLLLLHGFPSSSAQFEQLMRLLSSQLHVIAPDYPGFGHSSTLTGDTTFARLGESIERFIDVIGLTQVSLYMFDFGAPVGFYFATRHPERVDALVLQNANAYAEGFGPAAAGLTAYWEDRAALEDSVRSLFSLGGVQAQYLTGVPDPQVVNPDSWELDAHLLEQPGRDRVMLDLVFDIQNVVGDYPVWQEYLRSHTPPSLIPWGKNDTFFTTAGAKAFLADLPDAQVELLNTGHFATATHSEEIAELILAFGARLSADPS